MAAMGDYTNRKPLRQLDLCSGVGSGFPNAGIQIGLEIVGLCEKDKWCQDILCLRFPGVPVVPDVQKHDWGGERFYPDIITASPPCQSFSIQGKRLGRVDKRNCFPAVLRAIAQQQPRYFAIENVRGLLSCPAEPGTTRLYFGAILKELQDIGFDAEWHVVSSGQFSAPWLRERLLLVGISRRIKLDWERATPWTDQIGSTATLVGCDRTGGSQQPGIHRERLLSPYWLDRPNGTPICFGVDSGSATVRERRQALGNALDPRVARVALERILYYETLVISEVL